MSNVYGKPVPPKKDRREMARESARQLREEQQKKEKRNRWLLRGGIGAGLIAAAVVVALVVVGSQGPATPGPLNMASDGVLLTGDGTNIVPVETAALAADEDPIATDPTTLGDTANIVVYADYLCPFCGQFETTNGEQIAGWVAAGTATLELHPISILDQASAGSKYPTRAASALACVANYEPENVLAMNAALFANQPEENTEGLTNEDLVTLATDSGVTDEKVTTCITENTFADWVDDATQRALDGPIPNADIEQVKGTPTVLVNGVSYPGALDDPAAFEAFVTAQVTATE